MACRENGRYLLGSASYGSVTPFMIPGRLPLPYQALATGVMRPLRNVVAAPEKVMLAVVLRRTSCVDTRPTRLLWSLAKSIGTSGSQEATDRFR